MSERRVATRVDADWLIPDLLKEHPEARIVLDRHGLRGCGGRLGPYETLRFFARAHGVDESALLDELRTVLDRREECPSATEEKPAIEDALYRPFFLTAIAVVLTAGATWGAWILWNIGFRGSFTESPLQSVNAHGEAQIYGWVGLFIMGFAYQAFPRFWGTRLVMPRLAMAAFGLMVGGIVCRTIGMTTAGMWGGALAVATTGGMLQVAAGAIFAWQIAATFGRSKRPIDAHAGFIGISLACLVISSAYSTWHTWNTMTATSEAALVQAVATYQLPLRDLQVHGLALFMILGVSLRILPGLYNLPKISEARAWSSFGILVTALVAEIILFLVYRWTGNHIASALLIVAWLGLGVGAALIAVPWKLWRPLPESDRSGKFVRTAYLWLGVAILMLVLMPAYNAAAGLRFSHAYLGASRHAITVGFISLMIMGVASKVVPTLNGINPATLGSLRGPFLLVNLGCFLRVTLQVLTDWNIAAFPLIGLSGTLEVTGLAWWGLGLVRLMLRGMQDFPAAREAAGPRPTRIAATHRVADVLEWHPGAEDILVRHGFTAIRNPILRRTLATRVTLEQAARLHGLDAVELVEDLNRSFSPGLGSISLTVLTPADLAGTSRGVN